MPMNHHPFAAPAVADITTVPICENFDHTRVIGELRIRTSAIPPSPDFVFSIGYVLHRSKTDRPEPQEGDYTLVIVSPIVREPMRKRIVHDDTFWPSVHQHAFGNQWVNPPLPKICVVAARYGGCYEGGRFVALPLDEVDGPAFGDDVTCAAWWAEHRHHCGAGDTPNDALLDWWDRRQPPVTS